MAEIEILKDDERILSHGGELALYKRGKATWQYQLRLPNGKYERKTTHCSDLQDAQQFAENRYQEVKFRDQRGLSVSGVSVETCCKEYVTSLDQRHTARRKTKRTGLNRATALINTYLIPYFKGRNIADITERDIDAYHAWYRDTWKTGHVRVIYRTRSNSGVPYDPPLRIELPGQRSVREPKAAAIKFAQYILKGVFALAVRNGHISVTEQPTFDTIDNPAKRRGSFSRTEQRQILSHLEQSIVAAPTRKQSADLLLYLHVKFMLLTGLRPGKEADLRFRDVTFEPGHCWVHVRDGKMGPRKVAASGELIDVVEAIRHQHKNPAPDQFLWNSPNGDRPNKFVRQFARVLDELGLATDDDGNARTLYSLRHTYISDRLTLLHMPMDKLAINCGTSVMMITKHYAHLDVHNHIDVLTQRLPA